MSEASFDRTRMRLGCIFKASAAANAQYRAVFPMSALQHKGHEIAWCGASHERIPVDRLRRCDLVHIYRAADPAVLELMEELRTAGVAVTWDNDDDITGAPKEAPNYRKVGGLKGQRDFVFQTRAMRRADAVTTTSLALAEKFRRAGAEQVTVIENYVPWEFLTGSRPHHDGLMIGWLAGGEHATDAKQLRLGPILRGVLDTHPHIRVTTVGLDLNLGHARYERWERVELADLAGVLRSFDIGLAPLADIPFNRCRSTIKAKEYAAAGVPWLASPVGEYASLGARQGGRLVGDDQWCEALERLIRRPVERRLLAWRGRRWASRQTTDRNVGQWERTFAEAIMRARARRNAGETQARPLTRKRDPQPKARVAGIAPAGVLSPLHDPAPANPTGEASEQTET